MESPSRVSLLYIISRMVMMSASFSFPSCWQWSRKPNWSLL